MTTKEADSIAYEIIGLASGMLGGVWGYIDMAHTIKHLSNVSPKILYSLDLMSTDTQERQVLIDCGVDLTIEEAQPPDAASGKARWG